MLERLPGTSRAELRAEVKRRAFVLVSITRYPPLTRNDVLALLGFALTIGWATLTMLDIRRPEAVDAHMVLIMAPALFGSLAVGSWTAFYRPWAGRAEGRLKYVDQHLGKDAGDELAVALRVGWTIAYLVGALATGAMFAGILFVAGERYSRNQGLVVLGAIAAVVMLTFYAFGRIEQTTGLHLQILLHDKAWIAEQARLELEAGHVPLGGPSEHRCVLPRGACAMSWTEPPRLPWRLS
ncbi:hypothetical protein ICW40_18105, partial [Actinotalea ferrariae]|uniref:hypothetical protein n=1 Tax=Actinotalea ferrariae TaxID=1386098 RepID=UPI001C8B93EF